MEKEDQRIRLTKRLLKENLIELLAEKNIGRISVTELCSRSDINRSTFYQHYNTPKDVLLGIEREFSERAFASLKGMPDSDSFEERLTRVCSFIYENAALQRIILKNTPDLLDERRGLLMRDELGRLHAIHQQLELRQLKVPGSNIVAAAALGLVLLDVHAEQAQRVYVIIDALAFGLNALSVQVFHDLPSRGGMLGIRLLQQILHDVEQLEFLIGRTRHGNHFSFSSVRADTVFSPLDQILQQIKSHNPYFITECGMYQHGKRKHNIERDS